MQNTKQVLDGDNKDIFKRKREFYLNEDLVDKIDSIEYGAQVNKIEEIEVNGVPVEPDESKTVHLNIPRVIDALTSDSSTDALSARMGKYLYSLHQNPGVLYRYRGSVATINDLPVSGNLQGDVYNILETGMNYAWTGTEWDALGQIDRYDIFVTRAEYNALPSSKLTDGNTYFIVDSHYDFELITRDELEEMNLEDGLTELNSHVQEYRSYYESTGDVIKTIYDDELPEGKYLSVWRGEYHGYYVGTICSMSTNLTKQELHDFLPGDHSQERLDILLTGQRILDISK